MSLKRIWWKILGRRESDQSGKPDAAGLYLIDYEMMLKGSVYKRIHGTVRQMGVTVDGKTCLVTSGDKVDRQTYNALLEAGALREDYYGLSDEAPDAPILDDEAEKVDSSRDDGEYRISA